MIEVSAPGKLFLLGEYAVLDGAPAVLAAVDRRVGVTIDRASNDHWHIHAPDIGIDALQLGADGGIPHNLDPQLRARLGLYDTVRTTVARHIRLPAEPLAINIDSQAFSANGHKLGLGSSAAVAAALTAALVRAAGQTLNNDTLCRHAIAAHRQAQNGSGSGADVATTIYGGVIEYQADTVQATLNWPADITGMAVVTGDGASTPNLVARVRAYAQHDPTGYAADVGTLQSLAEQAGTALADADAFLELARAYFEALRTLDQHARAGIVLPRHLELAALAARNGGVFKTTGAGGGDLGLAFARRGEPTQRLADALAAAGARIVPLRFDAPGLEIR